MLRRTGLSKCLDYPHESYVSTVVDLFLRGIAVPLPEAKTKRRR